MSSSAYALLCLVSALAASPADNLLDKARKAFANDGVLTAWKLTQQALAESPDSAAALELSGELLFRRGEFTKADQAFQAALRHDPSYGLAWLGRARIAQCSSMRKTGGEYLRRAHELNPHDLRIFAAWSSSLPRPERIDALEQYASRIDPGRNPGEYSDLIERIRLERLALGRKFTVLATPYQSAEIPLGTFVSDATHLRTYVLEVEVNGAKLRLVLDTGSSGILMSRKAAERAGVTRLVGAKIQGLGDTGASSGSYQGVAERVRVGAVEFHDALVRVADQDSLADGDGLVGTDLFSDFLVTVDFAARKVRLDPLPGYKPGDESLHDRAQDATLKNFTPVYRFGHLLLVPTRVSGSREVLFIIDSGAPKNLISSDLAKDLTKVAPDPASRMSGLSGSVANVYQTGDLVLEFAGFQQKNLGITALNLWDQSRRLGTEVSGFLGLPLLELFTLTIDYRDGLVNFDRKGN